MSNPTTTEKPSWDRFAEVGPPWWDDMPVAVVAGGPSLEGFDFERLRGLCHVLAVKGTMFDIPWADAGFGLDMPRLREWKHRIEELEFPVYWAVPDDEGTAKRAAKWPANAIYLRRDRGDGPSDDPSRINGNGTSGYGGMNLVYLKRARQIVMFGFDHKPAGDGGWHHNARHYKAQRPRNPKQFAEWGEAYRTLLPAFTARGIEVLNACSDSTVTCFEKVSLDEAVATLERLRRLRPT